MRSCWWGTLSSFSHGGGDHRDLRSSPTRRSSDLAAGDAPRRLARRGLRGGVLARRARSRPGAAAEPSTGQQIEEHTSELQSQFHLVCRLLLEKKKRYLSGALTTTEQAHHSVLRRR